MPDITKGDVDQWRKWRSKFLNFVNYSTPGMKQILTEIQEKKLDADASFPEDFAKNKDAAEGIGCTKYQDEKAQVYIALKDLTENEALRVVEGVADEDGYRAWFELNRYFEPGLRTRQGQVLVHLNELMKKSSSSIEETSHWAQSCCHGEKV